MSFDCLPHQVSARRVLVRSHHHGAPGRRACWHTGPYHRRLLVPHARWQLCAVRYRARRAIGRLRAAAAASPNGGRAVHAQRTRLRCRRPGRCSCGGRLNSHPLSRGTVSLALCRKCNLCGSGTGESARLVCVDRSRGGRPLPGRGPHAMPRYLRSALVVSFETLSHRHAHRTGTVALVLADTCQSHAAGILLFRLPQTTFHTADSRRRLFPQNLDSRAEDNNPTTPTAPAKPQNSTSTYRK